MTLGEAYDLLGLVPFNRFLKDALAKNRGTGAVEEGDKYRGLGATTWMCVRAAMELEYNNVLLVGSHGRPHLQGIVKRTLAFAEKLHGLKLATGLSWDSDPFVRLSSGVEMRWTTCRPGATVTGRPDFFGIVFSDWEWAVRMERRVQGPFARVQEIWCVPTTVDNSEVEYQAYAGAKEFLMCLTRKGAEQLVLRNPSIRQIGWDLRSRHGEQT